MEKFRVTISIDVFGEDIEKGKKEAASIVKILNHNYDCNANIEAIIPCSFGSLKNDNAPGHEF